MNVDHCDGKSIARRSMKWLTAAHHDARAKLQNSVGYPAHERMWEAKATKYAGELDRREQR